MFKDLWPQYLIVFIASVIVTFAATPVFINIARRVGIMDKPGPRRVNVRPTPRFGGPAMVVGLMVALFIVRKGITDWPAIAAGGILMALIGGIDDARGLRASVKLVGQLATAMLVFRLGVRVDFLSNPITGGMIFIPGWLSFIMTVFWIVGITNTVNLIDGLDGLAAGIVCIASLTFFLAADYRGQESSALIALGLVGATAGFLRWNFYPAKTFMGDAGAYFLGFMVSVIAIGGAFKSTTAVTFLIPVLALGVPIFDTSFAILRRMKKGQSIMSAPDKGHVHHRLLKLGLQHRTAVIYVYITTLFLSVISLLLIKAWWDALQLLAGIALLVPFLILLGKLKKGRPHGKVESD